MGVEHEVESIVAIAFRMIEAMIQPMELNSNNLCK